MSEHLSENQVAAYADGRLPASERRLVEAHLADCAVCREEVVEVTSLIRPAGRNLRRFVPFGVAAAIAVVAIGISLRSGPDVPVLRSGQPSPALEAIAPLDQAGVAAPARFAWHSVKNAIEYRLTITSEAGELAAELTTSDTTITVLQIAPGTRYHWYVNAVRTDGSVISSRTQSFRTEP